MKNKLLHGDCLQVLADFSDNSIDLIVTDPPYGIQFYSNRSKQKTLRDETRITNDDSLNFLWFQEMFRVLKNTGACYVFAHFKSLARTKNMMKQAGFWMKTPLVWDKGNKGSGDLKGDYGNRIEFVVWGTKGRHILNGKRDDNLLSFNRPSSLRHKRLHPVAKPVDLLEFLIEKSSQEGDVILDPFMGSGSTCVAAKNNGRKYVGIEIEKKYYDMAKKRLLSTTT